MENTNVINSKTQKLGFTAFFLSGLVSIAAGVVVSVLQEKYNLSFSITGTLISVLNIGNMVANFMTGILPVKFGTRRTVLTLTTGYFLGYLIMVTGGFVPLLMISFALLGIAKGCALNMCTIMVGNNSADRSKGMQIQHSCYALGALLCPFVIAGSKLVSDNFVFITMGIIGLFMWGVFLIAGLPQETTKGSKDENGQKSKTDWSFMKSSQFWLLTAILFCQQAGEGTVIGWVVTYYKNQNILTGTLATYTVTIMWLATLLGRLFVAFVIPIKNKFRALAVMGVGSAAAYLILINMKSATLAILMLFMFSFALAGSNPMTVSMSGEFLTPVGLGVMLPIGGIGAILMPWLVGVIADKTTLVTGMATNVVPCLGIFVFAIWLGWLNRTKIER